MASPANGPGRAWARTGGVRKPRHPTAAGRLISSPYVKFGWHRALNDLTKEIIGDVSSYADSMYMLQVDRENPIDSLSMRNGLFWEHRQLPDPSIVSTPALDHIDLFPECNQQFAETRRKIARKFDSETECEVHYLFEGMRQKEFLLWPVEIKGFWATIVARLQPIEQQPGDNAEMPPNNFDRRITDFAIVDPLQEGQFTREDIILDRLGAIFPEGCIDWSSYTERRIDIEEILIPEYDSDRGEVDNRWKSGLIAFAFCREFIRRLKTLQFRRKRQPDAVEDQEFLWAPFEEEYNFERFRQHLTSACAHQCIEKADYRVRLALEVPSQSAGYDRRDLVEFPPDRRPDETWDAFFLPTHTQTVRVRRPAPMQNAPVAGSAVFHNPQYNSPATAHDTPDSSPRSHPPTANSMAATVQDAPAEDGMPLGATGFMAQIPGLDLLQEVRAADEDVSFLQVYGEANLVAATPTGGLSPSRLLNNESDSVQRRGSKRSFSGDEDAEAEGRARKRQK